MEYQNEAQADQVSRQSQLSQPGALAPAEVEDNDAEYYEPLVSWKASEFIHHQKNTNWFLPLAGAAVVLAVAMYFIGGGIIGSIMIITGAIAFGLAAGQEPKTLEYMLFPRSIAVGNKEYSYDDFKAFSVAQNGRLFSVILDPVKRFLPPVTIYFPEENGEKIFDILSAHLPTIEARSDPVESLMRKLRF
jgi:hypothetical protein